MTDFVKRIFQTTDRTSRWIIWTIGFMAFLDVYAMQSVLPLVMKDLLVSPVEAGETVGATVLAIALVAPFIGMLSDVIGRKGLICTSLFALSVPTALIPLSHSLQTLLILRFTQGLAVPGIVVVIIAYIGEEFGSTGVARMTSTYVGGTVMGGFMGRFITGHAGHWFGWRGAFFLLAGINLLGTVIVYLGLPESRHFAPNKDVGASLRVLKQHLKNPGLLAVCGMGFCVLFSLVGAFTYVNLHLSMAPFNLSTAGLANIFCVYLLGVVATPLAGRYIARYGFLRSVLVSLFVSSMGLVTTLLPSLTAVVAGLAVCACGVFICQSATIGHLAVSVTEGRSLATGIYYMAYYAGGASGSLIAGIAYEANAWLGSVLAIVLFQLIAAGIAWFFLRPAGVFTPAQQPNAYWD